MYIKFCSYHGKLENEDIEQQINIPLHTFSRSLACDKCKLHRFTAQMPKYRAKLKIRQTSFILLFEVMVGNLNEEMLIFCIRFPKGICDRDSNYMTGKVGQKGLLLQRMYLLPVINIAISLLLQENISALKPTNTESPIL